MAIPKVGDNAHTPHGIGRIAEVLTERGRQSFRVAVNAHTSVWVDQQKLRLANDGPLFSQPPVVPGYEDKANNPGLQYGMDDHYAALAGLESTIEPGDPYSVNEKNHATLPYDWQPQHHVDQFRNDQTIKPAEWGIDPKKRLHPTDSLSGASRSEPKGPQPNPELFEGGGGDHPFASERTSSLHQAMDFTNPAFAVPHGGYDPHFDSHSHDPDEFVGDTGGQDIGPIDRALWKGVTAPGAAMAWGLDKWDQHQQHKHKDAGAHSRQGPDHEFTQDTGQQGGYDVRPDPVGGTIHHHQVDMGDEEYKSYLNQDDSPRYSGGAHEQYIEGSYRPAGLSDRYAFFQVESSGDSPAASFRRDPQGFIRTCGHLWSDGDSSLEKFADYTELIDSDPDMRTAAWADVRQKAMRLRHEGQVQVNEAGANRVYATVNGDSGVYDVMIYKAGAFGGNQSVLDWACSCDWGKWAFKRKFSYVGRLCSHAYAAYLDMGKAKKTGASVEDYKSYLEDNTMSPEASSVASYLNTQGNDASHDEVNKLYDHISNNPAEAPERDYESGYVNQPDDAYKTADLLRTSPQSLAPNLRMVPQGEGNEWVDVEKDDRKTTGPDQIMKGAAWHDEADESDPITNFSMHTALMSLHGSSRYADKSDDSLLGELRQMSVKPVDADGNRKEHNQKVRDLVSELNDRGYDASMMVAMVRQANPALLIPMAAEAMGGAGAAAGAGAAGGGGAAAAGGAARGMGAMDAAGMAGNAMGGGDEEGEEPGGGGGQEQPDSINNMVPSQHIPGQGGGSFTSALHYEAVDSREDGPSDGNGDFLGFSGPGFPDQGYAGSGPAPKDWISDSAGYVDENERPHIEDDWHSGEGDIIKFNDGRSKPPQGPGRNAYRQADLSEGTAEQLGAPSAQDIGLDAGGAGTPQSQMLAHLHYADQGLGYSNPNGPSAGDWGAASGEDFANALGQEKENIDNAAKDPANSPLGAATPGAPFSPGASPASAAGGEAAGGAGELGELAMMAGRHSDPEAVNWVHEDEDDGQGYGQDWESPRGKHEAGFSLDAFDRGEFSFDDMGGGELRRASRVGGGPVSAVRIDPGARGNKTAGQTYEGHMPEDFGFDGGREIEAYLAEDASGGEDIIANFHRSGAAGAVMAGAPAPTGGMDDFASSPMVQSMLRTAGRKFSPEEMRDLEEESHHLGARNMPTAEELAGTHYALGL